MQSLIGRKCLPQHLRSFILPIYIAKIFFCFIYPNMSKKETFSQIQENLTFLDDWEERYRYLIELGQGLETLSEEEKNEKNKVQGCVSQVWLVLDEMDEGGQKKIFLRADSDAMIVKGLIAILIALFSGKSAKEILEIEAIKIFDELNLREHLTAQRSNGLVAMVEKIKQEAAKIN